MRGIVQMFKGDNLRDMQLVISKGSSWNIFDNLQSKKQQKAQGHPQHSTTLQAYV